MTDPDFATRIDGHRSLSVARRRSCSCADPDLAKDVVQDTLVAALQGEAGFSGRSSLKTWLTGILKHKIVDAIRRKGTRTDDGQPRRRNPVRRTSTHCSTKPDTGRACRRNGVIPRRNSSAREFFDVVQFCLDKLPPNTARVFMMREVMELDGSEICKELLITSTNLWVILYRARVCASPMPGAALVRCQGQRRLNRRVARRGNADFMQGRKPPDLADGGWRPAIPAARRHVRLHLLFCDACTRFCPATAPSCAPPCGDLPCLHLRLAAPLRLRRDPRHLSPTGAC